MHRAALGRGGGVAALVVGHRPGDCEVHSIPEPGLSATVVSLCKKLCPHCSSHPAVKLGTYCLCCNQGTAEKQPSGWCCLPCTNKKGQENKQKVKQKNPRYTYAKSTESHWQVLPVISICRVWDHIIQTANIAAKKLYIVRCYSAASLASKWLPILDNCILVPFFMYVLSLSN